MSPAQEKQLEKIIDEVLKGGDVKALDAFLQSDIHDGSSINCSQQFLTKLDKLVSWSLDEKHFKSASLGLAVLHTHGRRGIMAKGLHKMLVQWFGKCRQLWIQRGPQWDEALFNLSEDFFDALMVVHDSCEEGTYQITELFLYPVGQLTVDPRIYILIQKEAIRKFNLILGQIPGALEKKMNILSSQEASDIMIKIAVQILDGGDFDFQIALLEALCRMATPSRRKDLADRWFEMEHVASAFVKIRDSEFETDCRKFLNLVNGMRGDGRRVYSYPCLEAYLDKYELLMPADEKLEEFWIDFNLGSHSISFYFSLADGEPEWETICITENEVKSYTITEEGKRFILRINLSEVLVVGGVEGSSFTIHFSSSLDILHATRSVYGHVKNKGFLGKTSTSVVKTTVKITMDENGSQMVSPARMKISESSVVFRNSTGGSVTGSSSLCNLHSTKGKRKPSLEMVRSCDSVKATPKICSYGKVTGGTREQSDAPQEKTASKQAGNKKVGKNKKNIPEDFVPAGQKDEQSMESSSRLPVPGPISPKKLHREVFQRLKMLVGERNQSLAPREPVEPQKKLSNLRANCKDRSCNPQEQEAQTAGLSSGKSKGQAPPKVDASLIKAPAEASTTRALERRSVSVKAETKKAPSKKEKSGAELVGNVVKSISSRYETKPKDVAKDVPKREDIFTFNPVSPSNTEKNIADGKENTLPDNSATLSSGIHHSSAVHSSTKKKPPVAKKKRHVKKHLFSDTDTDYATTEVSWLRESSRKSKPKIAKYSRQIPDKHVVLSAPASSESPDLALSSGKRSKGNIQPRKNKPVAKMRVRQPKKTVQMAAAPTRPRVASGRPQRAAATCTKSYKEQDTDGSHSEPDTPSVAKSSSSNYVENADTTHESAEDTKRKTGTKRLSISYKKMENGNHSRNSKVVSEQPLHSKQQRPENVIAETSKLKKRIVSPAREQKKELTYSRAACQTPSSPSAPLIEVMRSAERSDPTFSPFTLRGSPLPASINASCQDTPSPILLLSKPCYTVSSKGNIKPFRYNSTEKTLKTQFLQSPPADQTASGPNAAEVKQNLSDISLIMNPVHHLQTSPLPSPQLTSTLLDLKKPSLSSPHSPFPKDTVNRGSHCGFNKVSPLSQISLSLSSTQSSVRINDSPTAALELTTEKSPSSNLVTGPSRKRHISSINTEEAEKEEIKKSKMRGQRSPRIKPRKLFESFAEAPPNEISQLMSSSHTMSSGHWEAEEGYGDVDMDEDLALPKVKVNRSNLCQKFSPELREKFESRYKMIYDKQSLKTIQHHVSSLNMQVASDRTQRQQKLQEFLLEEISKLEQNDTVLNSMDKDLALFWKTQAAAFCSFKEQDGRRNESMRNAFQNNVRQSLEHEKKAFTSQMCLIKKDMKSVQDRLVSQMQEEQIQSVKRGLHALFFP
ncbi:synaptonemal complex protein 2 [Brachionichthys hirsutus]|uniref:synaptonemal complex protein 2 n=1 Tax=Brachionichthys hirsutus TaxID=412623 RepID=UPI003605262B